MPDPRLLTTRAARELLGRSGALAVELRALGGRGAAAAAALAATGTPPPEDFVNELGAGCRRFDALRAEALAAAAAAGMAAPPAAAVASTSDLLAVLGALLARLEAAERCAELARVRDEAVAMLDRVADLAHRDDPAFAWLGLCQKRASEVRVALVTAEASDPGTLRAAVVEMTAPFAALLTLLDGAEAFDDARWAAVEDTVAEAFGRPLAVAAVRGRLRPR